MKTDNHLGEQRRQLLSFYRTALARVHGERIVADYLTEHPVAGEWAVVAVGKAAAAMALGAQLQLGSRLHSGLVITRYDYGEPQLDNGVWQTIESGHPLPDEMSLLAGEALLHFLEALPGDIPLLFLLSGGASALVEVLPTGITLADLGRVNEWLLASGLEIAQMNSVRRRLSRLKGGQLSAYLHGRRCLQLIISDVPDDEPAVIGSAPLWPGIAAPMPEGLPAWIVGLLQQINAPPTLDDSCFTSIETIIVADNGLALEAVKERAEAEGLAVYKQPQFQGDAVKLAGLFCQTLLQGEPGLYLWGGESSVKLPSQPGEGGRSQHLALAAAERLAGRENILLLAVATDGSDGPGESAGALVDGGSKRRGELEGLSLRRSLDKADSGSFLEVSGDLVETGPTGSNVMDLVLGLKLGGD